MNPPEVRQELDTKLLGGVRSEAAVHMLTSRILDAYGILSVEFSVSRED